MLKGALAVFCAVNFFTFIVKVRGGETMKKRFMKLTALSLCAIMGASLAGCQSQTSAPGKDPDNFSSVYTITEENEAPEITMDDQPEAYLM